VRLVRDNPELYEELGHDAFFDRYTAQADDLRKERKEKPCPECKGTGKIERPGADGSIIGACPRRKGWGTA
jgi:hypothetical protein